MDIDLPGGVIEGIVVDSLGKGVPDAEVIVRRGTLLEANGATDESGHFRLFGLREGEVAVLATKRRVESDEVKQVVAENAAPVTLELRETVNITGRIVRMDGSPVTGAVVRYLFGTRAPDPAISGPTGYFSLKLPQNAQSVIVVVIAEGLPVKLEQVRLPKDGNGFEIRMTGVGGTLVVRPGESSRELPLVYWRLVDAS